MTEDTSRSSLERKLAQRLNAQAEALDPDVARRLRLARHAALDELDAPTRALRGGWVAAAAGVALLTLLAVRFGGAPDAAMSFDNASAEAISDLDLLTEDEDLELLEDLEFFRWLSDSGDDLS